LLGVLAQRYASINGNEQVLAALRRGFGAQKLAGQPGRNLRFFQQSTPHCHHLFEYLSLSRSEIIRTSLAF
jgi:hypothetical protein